MTRTFPIMLPMIRDDVAKLVRDVRTANTFMVVVAVPWELIAQHERQAQSNHSQSLERLAERGGLSPCEALAVIEDRQWRKMDQVVANTLLLAKIIDWMPK